MARSEFGSYILWSVFCLCSFVTHGVHSNEQNAEKHSSESEPSNSSFNGSLPANFLFGTATGSYQVEGGWNADGKGENIWDHLAHTRPEVIKKGVNGDVACDSYHLFKEDVALIKETGFQFYRFSVSWARILPNGEITEVNQAGVNYYHALIDELLKNGIQPMITIYHWDLPQRLQDMGGWMNPLIIDFMEDYADLLFKLYGEKVKLWLTINEPELIVSGYSDWFISANYFAPGLLLESPANYIVAYNALRAHARVYRLYDQKYRASQNGKIGLSVVSGFFEPETNATEDVEATERAWAFGLEIFTHPIFSEKGDFPELLKKIVGENSKQEGRRRSRLPQFTDEEIQLIKGSSDFFGLNHYGSNLVAASQGPYSTLLQKDKAFSQVADPKWPRNALNLTVNPSGLGKLLRFIKDKYNNPPVFIAENGYCGKPDTLDDTDRVNYFRDFLYEVFKAKEQFGCNIIGYTAWSLMDLFEWTAGYEITFGLYHVNFTDPARKRTAKSSAKFFKDLLKTRIIPT